MKLEKYFCVSEVRAVSSDLEHSSSGFAECETCKFWIISTIDQILIKRLSRSVFNLEFLCAIDNPGGLGEATDKCLSEQPSCFLSFSTMHETHFIRT